MSNKLAELRGQRDRKAKEAKAISDQYPGDKRMPRAEADKVDSLLFEVNQIDAEIDRHAQLSDAAARNVANIDGSQAEYLIDSNGERINVLRTQAEIRNHYTGRARLQASSQTEDFSLADFVRGVAGMKMAPGVKNALSEGTDSAGGYTVPNLVMPGIMEALVPVSSLLTAGAGIIPLNDGAKTYTFTGINAIPTAAWRAESGAVASSDPTFRAVVATPRSLAFLFKASRELLADSPNIDAGLRIAIAQAFAKELDRAGLRGTGTGPEPRGVLNTSGIQAVTNGANGLALGGYANFFSAVQAILSADGPMPTAAIMAPRSLVKLGGLLDTTNQPILVPPMLAPVELIASSQIPVNLTVGSSTDCSEIYVGDFAKTVFAIRENVSIMVADQLYAATGEVAFICHVRADFVAWYPSALAVVTGVRA